MGQLFPVQLGNLLSVQHNLPFRQRIHTAQDIEQRGFTGTGGANNDHQLSLFHFKIRIVKGIDPHFTHMISFADILKFHKRHTASPHI